MIKKFIGRLFGQTFGTSPGAGDATDPKGKAPVGVPRGKRVEVAATEHGIDATLLDERAVKVVATLKEAGHEAYIVGGAVRDLLVGRRPKDFDVATSATPEEVKALFKRAFIIGRRFRIVHVVFGRGREHEVIEVSTFRAYLDAADADQVQGTERSAKSELAGKTHVVDASGRVLRDNVWGPQIEDAARRDFTVNAMYYDPITQVVVDYHGGLKDVRQRVLRMIGDPATRYREDPVRIVRAMRFAAKLGFDIEPKTLAPLRHSVTLLDAVPPSRLFDEMIKLMQTGHALASVQQLQRFGVTSIFPILERVFGPSSTLSDAERRFVELALDDTDRRVADGRAVAPSFLLACLLWDEVEDRWQHLKGKGGHPFPSLQEAIDTVFDARVGDISGRGKLGTDMREMWLMQPRFERRSGSGPYSLVEQPRYRAGYDFLRLRADAGACASELADWWEDFALGDGDEREALLAAVKPSGSKARRVPRASADAARVEGAATAATQTGHSSVSGPVGDAHESTVTRRGDVPVPDDAAADAPARKRRRRRRKPAVSAAQGGGSGS